MKTSPNKWYLEQKIKEETIALYNAIHLGHGASDTAWVVRTINGRLAAFVREYLEECEKEECEREYLEERLVR